jgi:hypothetical protein
MPYFEISAKNYNQVEKIFIQATERVFDLLEKKKTPTEDVKSYSLNITIINS